MIEHHVLNKHLVHSTRVELLPPDEIRRIRKRLGATAAEFAEMVSRFSGKHVSGNTIARWELGLRHPSHHNMVTLNTLSKKADMFVAFNNLLGIRRS